MAPHRQPSTAHAPSGAARLPQPHQLARLGTVLCVYRGRSGGELAGWGQAVRAEVGAAVDSDGMRECLVFYDAAGECCWRLYLLPDSDFLAWERLADGLPALADAAASPGIAERLLQRLAGRVRGGQWQASVLHLHALPGDPAWPPRLTASLTPVSPLGAAAARRIADSLGADTEALSDDCCCLRAARAAARAGAAARADDDDPPVIRLRHAAP